MSTSTVAEPSVSNRSWIEAVPTTGRKTLDISKWVTVISAFEVSPAREEAWIETWRALRHIALSRPECLDFQILRDRNDLTRYLVHSEWQDVASFHRFVRETSLLWLDRVLPGLCLGSEFTVLEHISDRQRSRGEAGE